MKISHKHLVQVVALDRHRHFGRAARNLSLSQPALSRSIRVLEQGLGLSLFQRSRAGVAPTEAGLIVLSHAKRVLSVSADLEAELNDYIEYQENELSIAIGMYPAELSLPSALGALSSAQPELALTVEVADWVKAYRLLEQGKVHLALCERSGHEAYASEAVNQRPVYFVVRRSHPLLDGSAVNLEKVLSFPWASSRVPMRAFRSFGRQQVMAGQMDREHGVFSPAISAPAISTALRLTQQTDVMTIAPLTIAEPYLVSGDLALVPFSPPWLRLNYGFAWHPEQALSRPAREFMDSVRRIELTLAEREQDLQDKYQCHRFPVEP